VDSTSSAQPGAIVGPNFTRVTGTFMAMTEQWKPRVAGVDDSDDVARLLHDFNTEFDAPSPGPVTLVTRLRALLAGDDTFAVLVGEPAVGVGLVTTRPNVWYEGAVALLDELYVAPEARWRSPRSWAVSRNTPSRQLRSISNREPKTEQRCTSP
jgi:hypothetical protein